MRGSAPSAGSPTTDPSADARVPVPSSIPGEELILELIWESPCPDVAPRRAILAERVAEMIGGVLRFRDRLRGLNSPFSTDPTQRRRLQARLARFKERTRAAQGLKAHASGVAALAAELLSADVVQVFLSAVPGSIPVLQAVQGLPADLIGRTRALPGPRSLAGYALAQRAPVVSDNLARETRFHVSALARRIGARSALSVPIFVADGSQGAIVIHWTGQHFVRSSETHVVRSLAGLIAASLDYRTTCQSIGREMEDLDRLKREVRGRWIPALLSMPGRPRRARTEADSELERTNLQEFMDSVGGGAAIPDGPGWSRCLQAARRDELLSTLLEVRRLDGTVRRLRTTVIPRWWASDPDGPAVLLVTDVTRECWVADQLRAAVERWKHAAGDAVVAAAIVTPEGRLAGVNDNWRRRRLRGGCGASVTAFVRSAAEAPLCSDPACVSFGAVLDDGLREVLQGRRITADAEYRCSSLGSDRWFAVRIESVGPDPDGSVRAVIVEWDVTARRLAEEELRRKEAGANAVFRSADEAILTVNHRGIIEGANPSANRMFGLAEGELTGRRLYQLFPAPGERGHDLSLRRTLENNLALLVGREREARGRHASGRSFPMSLRLLESLVGAHPTYTVLIRDLTEQRQVEEAIEKLTFHDPVTGLANRHLFRDRLDLALAQARKSHGMLGVLFVDIDRFKRVNESWGLSVGDDLLGAVARRLEGIVRPWELVARWSGDEYNLLLPRIRSPEEALATANRVRLAMREPFDVQGHTIYATASVGLSVYPRDGTDSDALIRHADMAMYRAKRLGTPVGQLPPSGSPRTLATRQHLDVELHRAVEHGEFVVHFQPEVELPGGRVTGAECLVRWIHPRLGLLRPHAFIALAERTGLIVPIGHQVLGLACRQIATWQASGVGPLRVAVNLSLRQVQDPGLVRSIEDLIRNSRIDPSWLDLEITESIALSASSRRARILDRLKALGIRMSLDDFGRGYSSLSRLRRLPIETLKIDRSFVCMICRDPRDAAIVRAIIQMGHSLGLRVVAEGVTRSDEAEFLATEECDAAQGFFFGMPAPLEDFERFISNPGSRQEAA